LTQGQSGSKKNGSSKPPRRAGRVARAAAAGLLVLLVLAVGLLWVWAGTEGSLAEVLRWAGARLPLASEQVSGTLRGGGTVRRLVWSRDGLRVEIDDAELRWTPLDLLRRTLHVERLSARRIVIADQTDQRPANASAGAPPSALALPLNIRIDALRVGELAWAGPPARTLHDLVARYAFDGTRHRLDIEQARFETGRYRARATLGAHAPLSLDVALAGALQAPVPGAEAAVPVTLQARLHGPLTALQAWAAVQAVPGAVPPLPAADAAGTPADKAPLTRAAARATARVTPWAAQPLPEAHGQLAGLDVGAFWPQAPRTALSGTFDLTPAPGAQGWAIRVDLRNADAGPWDRQRLPVEALRADATWQGRAATVRTLEAELGGGTLQASGTWDGAAGARWRIEARATGIDPARLHSRLAALPLDGAASAEGQGAAIDFDARLQARAPGSAKAAAGKLSAALRLRSASARGRWADGWLTLRQLDVRSDDARAAGRARLHLAGPSGLGGSADITVTAPGLQGKVQGELQATRGGGTLQIELQDAARALTWAQTLPGAGPLLDDAGAQGSATLQARWAGGWRDPEVHARLHAPSLQVRRPLEAAPWQARDVDLKLDGRLARAQLSAGAQLSQGARQFDVQASADLARITPKATLATSSWRVQIKQLQARLRDPAFGDGAWRLASAQPFTLEGVPRASGPLSVSAGTLTLSSPEPAAQAQLAWGPARWHAGALSSTGRITGLPLQWAERLAGANLADAGIEGQLLFDGQWDLNLGSTLRLRAELARASGDLTLVARDAETGVSTRVPAGLRQARLQLASDGPALTLQAQWDSARAGNLNARLRTTLSRSPRADGGSAWQWAPTAPLDGQLQARLPQITAWSALAPPGWRLRGALAADVRIAGTREQPRISGQLSADDVALRSVVDGFQLDQGRLRARLDGTRLIVDELRLHGPGANDAGGTLSATGEAGWRDGRAQARLAIALDHLHASVRADRDFTVSGQVQAALDARQVTVSGGLRVDRARIELPDDSAPALGNDVVVHGGPDARDAAPAAPAKTSPLRVDARLRLDLGDDLRVRGQGVDTRLAGTLQLSAQGPLGTPPQLTGTIRTEGGRFHAYSQNLDITRGTITFTGAIDNPRLDIIALRPIYTSDQRVGVQVAGSALLPRVRLYSDPQLPDNQALAWLLLGHAAPTTGAESALLQSAALALLGGREGRGLAARFGLDELSFSSGSDGSGGGTVGSASATLGKRLSQRLYAAYQYSLAGTSGALLIFYELSRRWSLRAQTGENAAVDLIYRLSFN
jgi:translocation and assembly module TamB